MPSIRLLPAVRLPRRRTLALLASWGAAWLAPVDLAFAAETPPFRVIVHPSNPLEAAERSFVADAFLKKVTRWNDSEPIRAVDLRPENPARRRFSEEVLKRSVGAVRSFWQQRIFSGRDVPPPELESDESVVAFVAKYPGAIGYVAGATKLTGVRALVIH
jgi:ABC-type phosphate transport system substrate-binding protein